MTESTPTVQADSHLTLHYRISLADGGGDVVSTFGAAPATLQMGLGQLAEPLERCLLGLAQGAHGTFDLPAGQAFGDRNPALVQRVARSMLDAHAEPGTEWTPGDLVDFPAPDGPMMETNSPSLMTAFTLRSTNDLEGPCW